MMQPYCRAMIVRGWVAEECGRVLSTAGVCDREPLHVSAGTVLVGRLELGDLTVETEPAALRAAGPAKDDTP